MNREIKFRAWDKFKKVFLPVEVYAILTNDFKALGVMIADWEEYKAGEYLYEYAQTVSQFTGLYDKNYREIYEGDVVKCLLIYPPSTDGTLPTMGEIVYCEGYAAFGVKNDAGVTLLHNHLINTIEVIGNIYQSSRQPA